jgi:predicted amidohydrolase YtcJ
VRVLAIAALVLGVAGCVSAAPDTVLLNGKIFTANPDQPWVEAVAIRRDRIIALGDTASIAGLATAETTRRNLSGRTVVPGLNDAHVEIAEPGASAVKALSLAAAASGVTSMHVFSMSRAVADTARDLVGAATPLRFRVFRAPRPGTAGETLDSRPHLPPQPSLRVDIRGMAFVGSGEDAAGIRKAVGWAYGSEDPLSIEPADAGAVAAYIDAIEQTGVAEVWARKRPRVENLPAIDAELGARLARAGLIVVQRPAEARPLASVLDSSLTLALGTGRGSNPFALLSWAVAPERGDQRLTMEQAIVALTRGSARAEFADGDKGHLSVGALADLAVLSGDVFTLPPDRVDAVHSVLTMIGGQTVYDVP